MLAAVKSLFGFCRRMAYIESDPAIALPPPRYESRLAERMIGEGDVERLLSVEAPLRDRALVARAIPRRPKSIRSLQPTLA
jgi:site-specific recombinase XerD